MLSHHHPSDVQKFFGKYLADHLGVRSRFAARSEDLSERTLRWIDRLRGRREGEPLGGSGWPVEVVTKESDLRVYYSPCYWVTERLVFGQPTTPVLGFVPPGRYRFATSGGVGDFEWDPGLFDLPPDPVGLGERRTVVRLLR
jgi:hypothetical protein